MEAKKHKPVLIVIAGPNGSGKTTITSRVLHHEWLEDSIYINPDNIAQKEQRTTFTSSPQHISNIVFPTFVFLVCWTNIGSDNFFNFPLTSLTA